MSKKAFGSKPTKRFRHPHPFGAAFDSGWISISPLDGGAEARRCAGVLAKILCKIATASGIVVALLALGVEVNA